MRTFKIASSALILSLLAAAAFAAAGDETQSAAKAPPASPAAARFEQLKKLAGNWKGAAKVTAADGKEAPVDDAPTDGIVTSFKVSSAGSSLVETMFPGSDHEMVTLYHVDGDALAVTHYCATGNQPHLKATKFDDPKTLHFDFVSAGNLKSERNTHMRTLVLTIKDDDHFVAHWQSWEDGKPGHTAVFDLQRAE